MNYHCFYCYEKLGVRSESAYHDMRMEEYHAEDDGYLAWEARRSRGYSKQSD